jgi:lipopolysaccharide biosynthesis glycosyltransferase
MHMTDRKIHLLLCCNRNYSQHLCVLLFSLLMNNTQHSFDIVVVSREPLGPDEDLIRKSLSRFERFNLRFVMFQTPPELILPLRLHYTLDAYTRIWIADFFPEDVSRVLYLDVDMLAVGDITALWQADLEGHLIGAVTIPGSTRCALLGIPEVTGYFNSGVLLFDLAQWRQTDAVTEVVRYIAANPDKLLDADQDALNACFFARRKPLPYIFNVISPFYFPHHDLGISDEALMEIRRQAVIVHFNGVMKPWHYLSRHPRAGDYYRCLRMTEWRNYVPSDRTPLNIVKRIVIGLLPARMLRAIGR